MGIEMSSVRINYLDEIEASGADAGYRITALTRPPIKMINGAGSSFRRLTTNSMSIKTYG